MFVDDALWIIPERRRREMFVEYGFNSFVPEPQRGGMFVDDALWIIPERRRREMFVEYGYNSFIPEPRQRRHVCR